MEEAAAGESRGGFRFLGGFSAAVERAGTVPSRAGAIVGFSRRRWNGGELWLPSRGPISLEKWGKEHQGLCPWTPWGKEFLSPTPLFSGLL